MMCICARRKDFLKNYLNPLKVNLYKDNKLIQLNKIQLDLFQKMAVLLSKTL